MIKVTKAKAAASLDTILADLNGSGVPGMIKIYSGAEPADLATAASGTLLATCPHVAGAAPMFGSTNTSTLIAAGAISGGKFAEDINIAATGTAGYFRLCDYNGLARLQGSIGTSGSDLNLDSTALVQFGTVTISAFSVNQSGIT